MKQNEYEIVRLSLPVKDDSYLSQEVERRVDGSREGFTLEIERISLPRILRAMKRSQFDLGIVTTTTVAEDTDPLFEGNGLYMATQFGFPVADLALVVRKDYPAKSSVGLRAMGGEIGTDIPNSAGAALQKAGLDRSQLVYMGGLDPIKTLKKGGVDAILTSFEPGEVERNGLVVARTLEEVKTVLFLNKNFFDPNASQDKRLFTNMLIKTSQAKSAQDRREG